MSSETAAVTMVLAGTLLVSTRAARLPVFADSGHLCALASSLPLLLSCSSGAESGATRSIHHSRPSHQSAPFVQTNREGSNCQELWMRR